MSDNMKQVEASYEDLKTTMLIAFDDGFSNGMTTEQMLTEMKAFVASTELGAMDAMVEDIFAEWVADRDL